jgi:hypothetical protein
MFRPHNSHKLVTKEDPWHVHKMVGVVCLLNYGYRYYSLFRYGTMDLNNSRGSLLVVYHAILSCSSMVFHIPSIRNPKAPMIYPEYRLHSILFVLRSVSCYFLTYYQFPILYKCAVCYATIGLADFISARYAVGSNATTTMRNMPFDKRVDEVYQKKITLMQSSQQISATLYMFGNLDSCFSPMFAIQISAFLMTLVRKNIIDSTMWHLVYNCSLWINIFCFWSLPIGYVVFQPGLNYMFYYWRFSNEKSDPQVILGNKYIGWAFIFTLLYYYERYDLHQRIVGIGLSSNVEFVIRNTTIMVYLFIQMSKNIGFLAPLLYNT